MADASDQPACSPDALWGAIELRDESEAYRRAQLLLESGADPNRSDPERSGETPFYAAWNAGRLALMRLLVEWGADPRADPEAFDGIIIQSTPAECTLYMLEQGNTFDQLVEVRAGASVYTGFHPLTCLLREEKWEHIDAFIPHGLLALIDVLEETSEESPLIEMVRDGKIEQVRWLLEHGAAPNARWEQRVCYTALDHAVMNQDLEITRLLISHGADPHVETWMSVSAALRARQALDSAASAQELNTARLICDVLDRNAGQ